MSSILNHPGRNEAFGEPDGDEPSTRKVVAMDAEREAFEKWAPTVMLAYPLDRDDAGRYTDQSVRCAWAAWQARSALAQPAQGAGAWGWAVTYDGSPGRRVFETEREALNVATALAQNGVAGVVVLPLYASPALGERQRASPVLSRARVEVIDAAKSWAESPPEIGVVRLLGAVDRLIAAERGEAHRE